MKTFDYIKIGMLLITLAAVLTVMSRLNSGHVGEFFSALGVQDGQQTLSVCKTRVHAVKWPDGRKIEELKQGFKMKWMAFDPEPREIGYLAIEKWLSQNCRIPTQPPLQGGLPLEFEPALVIEFVDKTSKVVYATPGAGARFRIDDQEFSSPEFARAIAELRSLAAF